MATKPTKHSPPAKDPRKKTVVNHVQINKPKPPKPPKPRKPAK